MINAWITGPARIIDPHTGVTVGYMDPISRNVFPVWPPPADADREPAYYDFSKRKVRKYAPLRPAERRFLENF